MVSSAPPTIEATISCLRPMRSATLPDSSSATASVAVETDKARLDWAGVREKSCASSGISGWTQ